jgi:hypothetical protein
MPGLVPSAFAVRSQGDLIVLDIRDDSYSLIVDAIADDPGAAMLRPLDVPLTQDALEALMDAGLIGEERATGAQPLSTPRCRLRSDDRRRTWATPGDVVNLLSAVRGSRRRLRRDMPCRGYRTTRTTAVVAPAVLEAAMGSLAAARLIVPSPARCLPASLVTVLFLARRGIAGEIVFGVRTHPFLAHCWVEVGGTLVDEEPERAAAYIPICVADA